MQNSVNKFFILSALLVLGILLLSACGSNKTVAPSSDSVSSEETPPMEIKSSPEIQSSDENKYISDLTAKGSEINEIAYDLIITGTGISYESKVWFKLIKMKADSLIKGQRTISIFDFQKREVISYLPHENMATKLELDEYPGEDNVTPMNYNSFLSGNNYKVTGTQKVNGMDCEVIEFHHEQGKFKGWLSTEYGIFVKFEQNIDGQSITTEFKNIRIGPGVVPEGTFALPERLQIIDLNDIMSNCSPSQTRTGE